MLVLFFTLLISSHLDLISCTKPHKPLLQSDVIEDVDATRLFRMIEEEDYLAVFFCESISLFIFLSVYAYLKPQYVFLLPVICNNIA